MIEEKRKRSSEAYDRNHGLETSDGDIVEILEASTPCFEREGEGRERREKEFFMKSVFF